MMKTHHVWKGSVCGFSSVLVARIKPGWSQWPIEKLVAKSLRVRVTRHLHLTGCMDYWQEMDFLNHM